MGAEDDASWVVDWDRDARYRACPELQLLSDAIRRIFTPDRHLADRLFRLESGTQLLCDGDSVAQHHFSAPARTPDDEARTGLIAAPKLPTPTTQRRAWF